MLTKIEELETFRVSGGSCGHRIEPSCCTPTYKMGPYRLLTAECLASQALISYFNTTHLSKKAKLVFVFDIIIKIIVWLKSLTYLTAIPKFEFSAFKFMKVFNKVFPSRNFYHKGQSQLKISVLFYFIDLQIHLYSQSFNCWNASIIKA